MPNVELQVCNSGNFREIEGIVRLSLTPFTASRSSRSGVHHISTFYLYIFMFGLVY
jgi:hypothetical protein